MLVDRSVLYLGFWPIFMMVVLAMFLRTIIMPSTKPTTEAPQKIKDWDMCYHLFDSYVEYTQKLGKYLYFITPRGQHMRLEYLANNNNSPLCKVPPKKGFADSVTEMQASSGGANPLAMMGPQIGFIIVNGGLGYIISYFFSGFIVAKTPFTVTFKFRSMLQRGVEIPNLDVSYISAMSWYFILLFGMSSVIPLVFSIIDPKNDQEEANMMPMMPFGGAANESPQSATGGKPPQKGIMASLQSMQDKSEPTQKLLMGLKSKQIQWAWGNSSIKACEILECC